MLELEHGFRVVDVHARLTPNGGVRARGRAISPERLERELHQAGIVRAAVAPEPDADASYVATNNRVARLSVDRPFVAFARIRGSKPPDRNRTSRLRNALGRHAESERHTTPEAIEQYGYDDRFHGFTLDPGTDGLPDERVLTALEEAGLPLLVSGGVDAPPETLAETLLGRSFPVVVAHFGGHPLDRELMDEMIGLLERYDDCYLDTSFVRYRDQLERALLEHPDRVLFGSGTPACHPNVAVMEILTLDVPEDKLRRAFSKNVARVVEALAPGTT